MTETLRLILMGLAGLQAVLMLIDEGIFHRRRGLERFERWGHVADTALFGLALLVPVLLLPTPFTVTLYIVLAVASCLLITKDEWIHARACGPVEHWCHALLFILHGALLSLIGILWSLDSGLWELKLMPFAVFAWGIYQHLYWNVYYARSSHQ